MECRICYSDCEFNLLQNICHCKGTVGNVHLGCLYKCGDFKKCRICNSQITIGILPKLRHFIFGTIENKGSIVYMVMLCTVPNFTCFILGMCTAHYYTLFVNSFRYCMFK